MELMRFFKALCLVYIAQFKRDQTELAKKYFAEYKEMPNSLRSLDYLGGTSDLFSAAKSKDICS